MISRLLRWLACLAVLFSSSVQAGCYTAAAERYGVPAELLRAIAKVETGRLPRTVVSKNSDGTTDIGRMQINSSWLPVLSRFGITQEHLKEECVSIQVGAWILARNIQALGWNWDAVGAYNVGCKRLSKDECARRRTKYAWKVFRAFDGSQTRAMETEKAVEPPVPPAPTIASVDFE